MLALLLVVLQALSVFGFKSVPSGVDTPSQLTQGEQWLSQVDQFLFRNIHASNFDSEVTDFLTDLVVAGWAALYADTNRDKGGFYIQYLVYWQLLYQLNTSKWVDRHNL